MRILQGGLRKNVQVGGAILLLVGYLQNVWLTLQALSFKKDEHGLWHVYMQTGPLPRYWALISLLVVTGGLAVFVIGYAVRRAGRTQAETEHSRLTTRHMLLSFGWVGLVFFGYMLLSANGLFHWVPASLRESPGWSSLSAVSMQIAEIIMVPLYYRKNPGEIGLRRPLVTWRMLFYVLMFFIMVYAMSILTSLLGAWLGVNTNSYREQYISHELHAAWAGSLFLKLLPVLSTALIAPLGEELLFRGVLQSTLTAKYGDIVGVIGSAFLFALVHADLVLFLPIFLIGLLFAVLRRVTDSLWAPVWLHVLNNLYASLSDLF